MRFLPFRDNYLYLRRGMEALTDPKIASTTVLDWLNKRVILADVESLHAHAIVADGRAIGIWDYDPDAKKIEWATFAPAKGALAKEIARAADETESFIRDELGDLLFYAVDNERNRAGRLEGVKSFAQNLQVGASGEDSTGALKDSAKGVDPTM